MKRLSLSFPEEQTAAVIAHRAAIASLPRRLVEVEPREQPDVVVVDGSPGWPTRIGETIGEGAPGVVLSRPGREDPEVVAELCRASTAAGVPVLVELPFLHDPSWQRALSTLRRHPRPALIESVGTYVHEDELVPVLLAHAALGRRILGVQPSYNAWTRHGRTYALAGAVKDTSVGLYVTSSCADVGLRLGLDIVETSSRWRVEFADTDSGRPTMLALYSSEGASHPRPIYESATRRFWRDLYGMLTRGGPVTASYGLGELVEDMATTAAL